jgi:hypothetical protein
MQRVHGSSPNLAFAICHLRSPRRHHAAAVCYSVGVNVLSAEGVQQKIWWGDFSIDDGATGRWDVGPLTLWLSRLEHEWRISYRHHGDPLHTAASVTIPIPLEEQTSLRRNEQTSLYNDSALKMHSTRFAFKRTEASIVVRPGLADRAVVVRPETPLYVPAGENVTLYVTTGLWLQIKTGDFKRELFEVPSFRASDTWFGTSTREGELCYASRTLGRLKLADLPLRYSRAVTPILVRNRGKDPLLVERIQLPVQYLALYRASNDILWTQPVKMTRQEHEDRIDVAMDPGAPPEAPQAILTQEPREHTEPNLIGRTFAAFNSLF